MWKGDDAPRPGGQFVPPQNQAPKQPGGSGAVQPATPTGAARSGTPAGGSIIITGELKASEDLTIEGQVDGKIELLQNVLTIGKTAKVRAEILAKSVIVLGEVVGNITTSEKLEIRDSGTVEGDIVSPRLAVADGATFRGRVDMNRGQAGAKLAAAPATPAQARRPEAAVVAASGQSR